MIHSILFIVGIAAFAGLVRWCDNFVYRVDYLKEFNRAQKAEKRVEELERQLAALNDPF